MNNSFKLSAIAAAVIASQTMVTTAFSAEKEQVEVIEVTGFRGSLQKAINAKRFADSVVDSIHAEDVGKSTDQNIADALSRVTGVTVEEADGEGTRISVRGAGASLNQISLNGVALTSGVSNPGGGSNASADQSVDLSSLSSDILASIDVIKTASAEHDEGSLGATVILRTVQPLSLAKPKRTFEYQTRYSDFSGEMDRKLSATFSDKYFDETFGFIVTVADETQNTRRDQYQGTYHADVLNISDGRARDEATGKIIRTYEPSDPDTFDISTFDPAVSISGWDEDKHIAHIGKLDALTIANMRYDLNLNKRDRQSINTAFQFYLGEDTELQIDVNHSSQELQNDSHQMNMQIDTKFELEDYIAQENLWTVNRESKTITKKGTRLNNGRIYRNVGGFDLKNNVASVRLDHIITESLSMSLLAGYSDTRQKSDPDNASLLLNNIGHQSTDLSYPDIDAEGNFLPSPPNEQRANITGYDCTSGVCVLDMGTQTSVYAPNNNYGKGKAFTPSPTNPLDYNLMKVANITKYTAENTDTNKSLFLDFDWDVDFFGVTQVEFGGKLTNRIKDVYTLREQLSSANADDGEGDEERISVDYADLISITMADVYESKSFPVNNFMDDIIPEGSNPLRAGWGLVSPQKALELATNKPNLTLKSSPAGSRNIEQDVSALYAQLNFEYLDGDLSGNIGLRHVTTETTGSAYNQVLFQKNANIFDPWDLVYNLEIANTKLAECQFGVGDIDVTGRGANSYPQNYPGFPGGEHCLDSKWVDNNGDTILGVDYPDNYDPLNVSATGLPQVNVNIQHPKKKARNLKPQWSDRRTNANSTIARDGTLINADGSPRGNSAYDRAFLGTDSAKNDIYLPSLNLNYVLSDEQILRFAISKTMARPKFDSTTPGLRLNESYGGSQGTGRANSVHLLPLESRNIDLSYEWYFNQTGLVSLALFSKKMTNFEENVDETWLWRDIRENYNLDGITRLSDVLILPEFSDELTVHNIQDTVQKPAIGGRVDEFGNGIDADGNFGCMPDRIPVWQTESPLTLNCHQLRVTTIRNGKGASIEGAEFTYTQNYDFLPGFLSGLGASVNYTYQVSESDPEALITGGTVKGLPQPNTPKHSGNATLFWEKDDVMLRLAGRYTGIQLISRSNNNGASWQDSTFRLDFSSSWKINNTLSLTAQALNLTDEVNRTFWTSTKARFNGEIFDEGNVMDGGGNNADTSRTLVKYKTGRLFRLGLRATF